jgi:hypothetical protein
MQYCEQYIDEVIKSAANGFPTDLVYLGYKRCTPQEEFAEATKRKTSKRTFDVARSDLYMMKYIFKFKEELLPDRFLYLPFVNEAGTITLGGSRFNVSPLLIDRVISVGMTDIFVRLLRDKLTFKRVSQHYMVDGKRETVQVVWSLIYHKNQKMKRMRQTIKANTTMMHYLLCKYGLHDTFLKFGKCKLVIGGPEVNKNVYPENEWTICSSVQVKPKGFGRAYYEPSTVNVAIRKEEMTPMVRNMLGGLFYIIDHFPTSIQPQFIGGSGEKRMWNIAMGVILWSANIHHGKLNDDIKDHIDSLDEYIDGIVVKKMEEIGVPVEDIYQLFAVIIEHFNDWLLNATDKVNSMYDKELNVLYHVLYEITSAIFKLHFKLKAAAKKEISAKEVIATMNQTLRLGLIYSMTKNHGEVTNISNPGDNKALKITSILVPQRDSTRTSNRKDRAVLNDPSKRMHVSVAEIGGYSNMPKSEPSGRSRINFYLQYDSKNVVERNPKYIKLLDGIQEMLRR